MRLTDFEDQLYALLSHMSILPSPYGPFPYSSASLRYALRMRPFTSLSIPEVPSYAEFEALASLPAHNGCVEADTRRSAKSLRESHSLAKTLVENAGVALKNARKEWDTVSKSSPGETGTTQCEEWWRADVKNVQRACIAANIALETARKAVSSLKSGAPVTDLKKILKVEVGEHSKVYHSWWLVPKITPMPQT